MGLKMKNINNMGVNQFLGDEGRVIKNNIYGTLPKNGSLDNLQEAWQKTGWGVV